MTLAPWHAKLRLRILVTLKAVFLENYLAVSTWILNGSSIECLEKKYQPFSLAGKYKTWTPGPWTSSVDPVHGPGPSKYGPGPWTPYFYKLRLHHKLQFDDL